MFIGALIAKSDAEGVAYASVHSCRTAVHLPGKITCY